MSLYTKYRPRDWDSVVGQDTISTILRTALTLDRVGHAYIFTGSRGTGKTTSARILAKGVNCKNLQNGNPCHECDNCQAFDAGNMLDVIEIDGASNNGVENVRDLIEKARFEPNQGKYKVYIIDEVHMLSTGAFNALLKTLEEPPDHVKFILATTEIDKVPETIRSRSLRFDFRKITEGDIVKRLEFVVTSEGIQAEKGSLEVIAKAARGGMRDALTLLEQHTLGGIVSLEYVRSSLSLIEDSLIEEVIGSLMSKDISRVFEILTSLKERHIQVRGFFDQILYSLRDKMISGINSPEFTTYSEIMEVFMSAYSKIKIIPDEILLIEITLMRAVKRGESGGVPTPIMKKSTSQEIERSQPAPIKEEIKPIKEEFAPIPPIKKIEEQAITLQEVPKERKEEKTSEFSFISLLNALKTTKPALVIDLKNARFEVNSHELKLIFEKEWNYNRVNVANVKNLLAETLENTFGGSWKIECTLGSHTNHGDMDEVF